jgi:S1-C subfamily serine protease
MKKTAAAVMVALGLILAFLSFGGPSDAEIRDRVVKIVGPMGQCSGEQIQAPSGKTYILTAGHCRDIAINGSMEVITEDGVHFLRHVIKEDPNADLLLLEGLPNRSGITIAKSNHRFQYVRTFTHGRGLDTYTTTGILIQDKSAPVGSSIDDPSQCPTEMPKYTLIAGIFGSMCVMNIEWTWTTAFVAPGSSGGLVVNSEGEMVGLVSAGGEGFGLLTRLEDIQRFLAKD